MPNAAKPASQPLYESVRARIVERLRSGEWAPGARLPIEGELATAFGVGIGTIRRAVEELVSEGVLLRRARLGTMVAKHTEQHAFDLYFSFVDAAGEPVRVSAELLSFRRERADTTVAGALRVERGAKVARIENLRRTGSAAVMLDRIWVPLERFADLSADAFKSRPGSIYGFYQERYGTTVVRVVEDLGACAADEALAGALGVAPGQALLHVQRTAYTYKNVPVEYRSRYVDATDCSYRNVRGLRD